MTQNLSSYRIFYTVAKCGNISKAAKELYISQPAISKSIRKLEEGLNVTLFLRSSKGVTLTEEGSLLFSHVESAFSILKSGEDELLKNQELGVGHLKIGVSTTLCKFMLLPYLKKFIKQYPHMNISISCQSTYETLQLIEDNQVDIGLIGKPAILKNIEFDHISDIQDVFVASSDYLHNLRLRGVEEKDLFKESSLMLLVKENITRKYIDEYFEKHQIHTEECIEVSSMDLLIDFAKIGLGLACVIKNFVEQELSDGSLIEVKLPYSLKKREVGFAYKNNGKLTKSQAEFIEFYHSL